MAVRVEEVTKTKSGKGLRVKLSGTWYNAFLDSGLDQQVGKMIEAEIRTHEKFGAGVHAWVPVAAPQVSPPSGSPASPAAAAPRYAGEPGDNIQPWYSPFMSNVVAHAIEKGLISKPEELNEWALKAAQVAVAVKEECK